MELYVDDQKAEEGMCVKTFRGETAKLLSWAEPGTRSGGKGGRVVIEVDGYCREYYPSVIKGKFKD